MTDGVSLTVQLVCHPITDGIRFDTRLSTTSQLADEMHQACAKGANKMADRYTKIVLTVIAAALSVLAVDSVLSGPTETHSQTKTQQHCVWTHIYDQGEPNVGSDGNVDFSKGSNWKTVSEGGWELKVALDNNYVFEKCEP
jgi:hypothetical protein